MFKSRIADLNIGFVEYYDLFHAYVPDFAAEFEKPDLVIESLLPDINAERDLHLAAGERELAPGRYQMVRAFRKLADALPDFDAVVFHSCFIQTANHGVAFTARSGTGKTTHMLLWQRLLGDRMRIINGDKPIVRFVDGGLYGYGTPWNGKEHYYQKDRAPLTDICVIERSPVNETVEISREEGALVLLSQVHSPVDAVQLDKTLALVNRIAENCRFWKIRCNMELEAAEVAYNAIVGTSGEN